MVVAENTSPRDGRFVERVGHYNPMLSHDNPERVVVNVERAKYWLSQGAAPSERVALFLAKAGVLEQFNVAVRPKKSAPKRKAQERQRVEAEKIAAAEAEAAATA
jgi:small subunit ribosomal protein S16